MSLASNFAALHRDYLQTRGISRETCAQYGLLAGVVGHWAQRVIIPVFYNSAVVTFQGRKISNSQAGPKYQTLLTAKSADTFGGMNIKHTIFDHDRIFQHADSNRTLTVVEGAMDAINLSQYIEGAVTCVFGTSMSEHQAALIWQAAEKYERVVFLFDKGALPQAVKAAGSFSKSRSITNRVAWRQ